MHSYRTPSARPHLVRTTLTALAAVAASLLLAMPADARALTLSLIPSARPAERASHGAFYDPFKGKAIDFVRFVKAHAAAKARGFDVLIADSSYTDAEYPAKKGWGHGTFTSSIASAHAAGAKLLFCTHHEPTRSDDALEAAFAEALNTNAALTRGMDIRLAREGDVYEF